MIVVSGINEIDFEQYDEVWYITNNNPNMRIGAQHHKELAPFIGSYMKYRQCEITLQSLLTEYGNALWSGKYREPIADLIKKSDSGKWIQVVCYCPNYLDCHRYVFYKYLSTLTDKVCLLDAL